MKTAMYWLGGTGYVQGPVPLPEEPPMRRALVGAEREAFDREYLPLYQRAGDWAERYDSRPGMAFAQDPDLKRELAALTKQYWPEASA